MSDVIGTIGTVLIVAMIFVGLGLLLWTETDGYNERIRLRRAKNEIALDKARKEAKLDLKLREWQQTASLEDLTRHRERLERNLDGESL